VTNIHGRRRGALLAGAAALALVPGSAPGQTQVSGVKEASHIFCTSGCEIYGGQVNLDSTGANWILLLDASTTPANGLLTGCTVAATPRPCILKWYQASVSTSINITNLFPFNGSSRLPTSQGFVAACSSSSDPFTLTASTHCLFSFEVLAR
jgi:hypothetical protein